MRIDRELFDVRLRQSLESLSREIGSHHVDLTPRIEHAIRFRPSQGPRPKMSLTPRLLIMACITVLAITSAATVTLASSRTLRHLLQQALPSSRPAHQVGINSVRGLPVPHFHVLYPAFIPWRLVIRGNERIMPALPGHLRGKASGEMGASCPSSPLIAPAWCTQMVEGRIDMREQALFSATPDGEPLILRPALHHRIGAVWFGYHAVPPQKGFLEIAEWNARLAPIPNFPHRLIIKGHDATLRVTRGRRTLSFRRLGTGVVIETNLGRSTVLRVAASFFPVAFDH